VDVEPDCPAALPGEGGLTGGVGGTFGNWQGVPDWVCVGGQGDVCFGCFETFCAGET
jgi:hypothetical protein